MFAVDTLPVELHNGDRMTLEEFFATWERIPDLKRAELIDGVVYLPSPVSIPHSQYESRLSFWLQVYRWARPAWEMLQNVSWKLAGSSPQPDLALVRSMTGTYPEEPPALVCEISHSSRSYDLGPKLRLYERSGVTEYLAVLIQEKRVEWRVLVDGRYVLLTPDAEGYLKSATLAGLWLDPAALFPLDEKRLQAVLQQGLAATQPK